MKPRKSPVLLLFVLLIGLNLKPVNASSYTGIQAGQDSCKDSLAQYIQSYVDAMGFSGTILVSYKGNIIHHEAYGLAVREWAVPNTLESRYNIASISKPMTAFIVLKLVEEGKMKLTDPLSLYLPDFPRENGDRITIHQLLTHTAGIGHWKDAPEFELWKERIPLTRKEMIDCYGKIPLIAEPGKEHIYSSFGYNLLAYACESAAGESFSVLMKKYVFEPAAMKYARMMSETDIIFNQTVGYEDRRIEG